MMVKGQYYYDSRTPRYAVLFAAPLLFAYELLAWLLSKPFVSSVIIGARTEALAYATAPTSCSRRRSCTWPGTGA